MLLRLVDRSSNGGGAGLMLNLSFINYKTFLSKLFTNFMVLTVILVVAAVAVAVVAVVAAAAASSSIRSSSTM
jgi:hypothetical protein